MRIGRDAAGGDRSTPAGSALISRHLLEASERTVRVGVIDAAFAPVLTVASGDEVQLATWSSWGNAVTPSTTLDDVLRHRGTPGQIGPHSLTGPIAVAGAEPGDVLCVEILDLVPARVGHNMTLPADVSRGVLRDRFPDGLMRHIALDLESMTAEVAPGVIVDLRPFLGIIGVAPAQPGPHPSSVPGPFGGNIDLPDLVVGATLRLPVLRSGALLYVGDGHGCQGTGEVDQTALEVAMESVLLRVTVERGRQLRAPQAETPTHVITTAADEDLERAARLATEDALEVLIAAGADPETAYVLCSLAVDVSITQLVNGRKGAQARIPKPLLASLESA